MYSFFEKRFMGSYYKNKEENSYISKLIQDIEKSLLKKNTNFKKWCVTNKFRFSNVVNIIKKYRYSSHIPTNKYEKNILIQLQNDAVLKIVGGK